jgi:hypothetical protein
MGKGDITGFNWGKINIDNINVRLARAPNIEIRVEIWGLEDGFKEVAEGTGAVL